MTKMTTTILIAIAALLAIGAQAQQINLPQNRNAALAYWMAFANLNDQPTDEKTTKLIDSVLAGSAEWDDANLGPLVHQNEYALTLLHRATQLPDCDWGLDYSQGQATDLGHLPKARALARLNTLLAYRQMAKGDNTGAVETLLSGLRFAQDMSRGTSLIGALSAKTTLLADLRLLTKAVESGSPSSSSLAKIGAALKAEPVEGLDWISSIKFEIWADKDALKSFVEATPGEFSSQFRSSFGRDPGAVTQPTAADLAKFQTTMNDVADAFRLPTGQTAERIEQIQSKVRQMHQAAQDIVPNYLRTNEVRRQIAAERDALVKALAGSGVLSTANRKLHPANAR
ncbi:MAG TPA: hypothetical protein VKZ53_09970 [Candidatus Angelobacter sp.]|nr:hypothetical protein [Candidatus Angelobacter sp.]